MIHPYAAKNEEVKRLHEEKACFWDPYRRDVEKIIHSKAFRRYSDKTQVVYLVENDHLTYRSLHVQLVSSFGRAIAERLGLNSDLVEAIALGHDVGHPPFGHEGEGYLSEISESLNLGCFSHSLQSCRLYREIEPLNLSLATYDGFLTHDGGLQSKTISSMPKTWQLHFQECSERQKEPEKNLPPATLEGALVKLVDTVSYIGKDIEDALSLKLVDVRDVPKTSLGIDNEAILEKVAQDIVTCCSKENSISISDEVFEDLQTLRAFNFERIYVNQSLKVESHKIRSAYRYLFDTLLDDATKKGEDSELFRNFLHSKSASYCDGTPLHQQIIDYIAGMTDSYFISMLNRLIIPQKISL
jgi:dGTPase